MIIGITGGTGSGKTAFLDIIRAQGGQVLDCDAIYHQLLQTDKDLLNAIERRFPGVVEDGQLQRKKLGSIVFADPEALQDLNHITHSAVKAEVISQISAGRKLIAIDAIGLFEGDLDCLCDVTVAITAPESVRIQRLMARDGITEDYARSRIAAQPAPDVFIDRCDYHLENAGSLPDFQDKCLAFLRQLGIITV